VKAIKVSAKLLAGRSPETPAGRAAPQPNEARP
jgi:hypothetical protein